MITVVSTMSQRIVEGILNRKILFDYRRVGYSKPVTKVLMCVSGVGTIAGEFEILQATKAPIDKLWRDTGKISGFSRIGFDLYFKNLKDGYAYRVGRVKRFRPEKKLIDFGVKNIPQMYCYVKEPEIDYKREDLVEFHEDLTNNGYELTRIPLGLWISTFGKSELTNKLKAIEEASDDFWQFYEKLCLSYEIGNHEPEEL